MSVFKTLALFVVTAAAELAGCYLVYVWHRRSASAFTLAGAAASLALFAWLLALHPNAGRAYAAYGGVYVACAVLWGWLVDGQRPDRWDLVGAAVSVIGMLIIVLGPRS